MSGRSIEIVRMKGARAEFDALSKEQQQAFISIVEGAPFLVRTMGLGAGMATLASKDDHARVLAAMLARWLLRDCPYSPYLHDSHVSAPDRDWIRKLLAQIEGQDRAAYRFANVEALAFLSWLKRLAQAFVVKKG